MLEATTAHKRQEVLVIDCSASLPPSPTLTSQVAAMPSPISETHIAHFDVTFRPSRSTNSRSSFPENDNDATDGGSAGAATGGEEGVETREMLARAWCAEKGVNAIVSRKGKGCVGCAVREAGALGVGWGVVLRVG